MDSLTTTSRVLNASNTQLNRTEELGNQDEFKRPSELVRSTEKIEVANENPSLTVEEVDYAVNVLNHVMTTINRSLNFKVDQSSGRTVISIIDRDTDEVIKQIPSEDMLKLINTMQELQSLLAGEDV